LPLWLSYTLFDFCFILVISFALTITIWRQLPYWYAVGYLFPILALHGLAATLMGYAISTVARSQLAAFASTVMTAGLMLCLSILAFMVTTPYHSSSHLQPVPADKSQFEEVFTDASVLDSTMNATTFSLDLIFPIGNVFRALLLGLNIFVVTCQGTELIPYPGSIYAYGGPILYLCIQICFLWFLLLWLDRGSFPTLARNYVLQDSEKMPSAGAEVEQETLRVGGAESDLLRVLHVSKSYGDNLAVNDVSLGMGEGEILALLGTNGAGKTTIVNMIRGELHPDKGTIYVRGVDVHSHVREAQKYLGGT
jgi:ATP-binding cassette, subfamily A (ABC1), member 3